jgi:hypothetical protein
VRAITHLTVVGHVRLTRRAWVCFGEGTPAAVGWPLTGRSSVKGWRTKVTGLAWKTGVDKVLDELTRQRWAVRSSTKRQALTRLRNYVGERTAMNQYVASRARGMRWDPAGASAILSLTGLQDSHAWEDYWSDARAHKN